MFSALTEFSGPQKKVVMSSLKKLLFVCWYGTTHWVRLFDWDRRQVHQPEIYETEIRFPAETNIFDFFASMPGEYTVTQQ